MSRITPQLFYSDVEYAIEWLQSHFEFSLGEVAKTSAGEYIYAELHINESLFLVAPDTRFELAKSPKINTYNSQSIHVYIDNTESFYEKLVEEDITILEPLGRRFCGDMTFRLLDCEGHLWTFCQHIEDVDVEKLAEITL